MQGLSSKQHTALHKLLLHPTVKEAATAARISEATLFRWLQLPAFRIALQRMRTQVMETTLTALQSTSAQAVETLQTIMKEGKAPAAARVSAARCALEMALKGREHLETEARLQMLEAQLALRESK